MAIRALACAAALAAAAPAAQAILVTSSTSAANSFRTCVAGTSGCDAIVAGPPVASFIDGLPGAASAHVEASVPGYGSSSATVALSGALDAPVLSAFAMSTPGTRENNTLIALQSYTYTGAGPATRTFGGTLTYSQTTTGTYPQDVGVGIFADLEVFTLPVAALDAGTTVDDNFQMLIGIFDLPGYTLLGDDAFVDGADAPSGFATLGVTVSLQPGDVVWVLAVMQTPAISGGVIDASHTFVTAWDDPSGLTPGVLVSAVPEPDTQALMALGLGALAFAARRARRMQTRSKRAPA